MEKWIENPELMEADKDAEYAAVIEIPLDEIDEPLFMLPNDPDDVKKLSKVAGDEVHETFLGSCMTNIGHFRAAGKLLEKYGKTKQDSGWCLLQEWMNINLLLKAIMISLKSKLG